MAIGYIEESFLILFARTGELMPNKKRRYGATNRGWAIICMNNLSEEVQQQEGVQRWTLQEVMKPAVLKILEQVGAIYEEPGKNECLTRAKLVIDGINNTLNPALDSLEREDRNAGLI
jgi:hypothetical protein